VSADDDAAELLQAGADLAAARADVAELQRALATSRQIGMAMGILMERHRLTPEQAFDRLRDLSQRRNVKLRDLADQVVYTGDTDQRHD
jgi:AmiR/NasT family two-component response regulator